MTLGKILDYSQARPPLGKVKANGYSGVYRYVCSDASERGLPGKRLTPTERDQILAAGLDLGLHGEDDSGAAKLGYTRGKQQATQWADYASTVLDAPKGMTIVAAVDYDTAGTYPNVVVDYLGGVHDGFAGEYVVGVYGSIYVVDGALTHGDAIHGVQTIAWSNGRVSTRAHLYQHGGSEFPNTDYNDVLHIPHGTWLQTQGVDVLDPTDPIVIELRAAAKALRTLKDGGDFQLSDAAPTVGATLSAVLPQVNGLYNVENTQTAAIKAAITGSENDVAALIRSMSTAGATADQIAAAVVALQAAKLGAA